MSDINSQVDIKLQQAEMLLRVTNESNDQQALELIQELILIAPENRRVQQVAKELVRRSPSRSDSLKKAFASKKVAFLEEDLEEIATAMRTALDNGEHDEVDRLYARYKSLGKYSQVIEDRYSSSREQRKSTTIPLSVQQLINQARSSIRVGLFDECLTLCDSAMAEIDRLGLKIPDYLNELREEAQTKKDRQDVLSKALNLINQGHWEDSKRNLEAVIDNYNYATLNALLSDLTQAINEEIDLERKIQVMSLDDSAQRIIEYSRQLVNLPGKLNTDAQTIRQKRLDVQLSTLKDNMIRKYKSDAESKLRLSTMAASEEDMNIYLAQAQTSLKHIQPIIGVDQEISKLLEDIEAKFQVLKRRKIEDDQTARILEQKQIREKQRNKDIRRIAIAIIIFLLIVVPSYFFYTEQQEQSRIQSSTQQAINITETENAFNATTQFNNLQLTNAVSTVEANLTLDSANLTSIASTAVANETALARTDIARATEIQLTFVRETADAGERRTELARSDANAQSTATAVSILTSDAIRNAQGIATLTVEAIRTQTASAPTPTPRYACQGVVTLTQGVRVREQPAVNSNQVGSLPNAAIFEIYEYSRPNSSDNVNGWYNIIYRTDTGASVGGWVATDYVTGINCPSDFDD